MRYIDNTQYAAWWNCPLYWYERYYKGYKRVRTRQSEGAMVLGSLFHNGVEGFYKNGNAEINGDLIKELDPTPECFNNANTLIQAWIRHHPQEEWDMVGFEEPLTFDIGLNGPTWPQRGLAKLDTYFRVDKETSIEDGVGGVEILRPGYWIRDYKTYGGSDRSNYIKQWSCNMQADFQMLALGEMVGLENVNGMLIGVIEKPYEYVPKRKCKGCGKTYEFSCYVAVEDKYKCGWCGHVQVLSPVTKPVGYTKEPFSYYIRVERTVEQLRYSLAAIRMVAIQMWDLIEHYEGNKRVYIEYGLGPVRNTLNCVDSIYGPCEYYNAHVSPGRGAEEDGTLVKVDSLRYMGKES
jgi:hypothetical protein